MTGLSAPAVWRGKDHRYRLIAGKCTSCGKLHYPPSHSCPYCGSKGIVEVELPRIGRLVSYSVVYSVPFDSRSRAPVILGLVDLGVARIISEITDASPEDVSLGVQVEAVFRRIAEDGETGLIVYGIKFRPVKEA
ncbi:MAG: Zn-ribbon domain-containing OB-fold protein [Acidilobaceae archaeon]